jgi:hypothetical protein
VLELEPEEEARRAERVPTAKPPPRRPDEPEDDYAYRVELWLKERRRAEGIKPAAWTRGGPTVSESRLAVTGERGADEY